LKVKQSDFTDKGAQINELKTLIQAMNEQKNKDIKNADEKNIKAIKKAFANGTADKTMTYVIDNLMKFVTHDINATF